MNGMGEWYVDLAAGALNGMFRAGVILVLGSAALGAFLYWMFTHVTVGWS